MRNFVAKKTEQRTMKVWQLHFFFHPCQLWILNPACKQVHWEPMKVKDIVYYKVWRNGLQTRMDFKLAIVLLVHRHNSMLVYVLLCFTVFIVFTISFKNYLMIASIYSWTLQYRCYINCNQQKSLGLSNLTEWLLQFQDSLNWWLTIYRREFIL